MTHSYLAHTNKQADKTKQKQKQNAANKAVSCVRVKKLIVFYH